MKLRISIAISIAAGMGFPQFAAAVSPTSQELEGNGLLIEAKERPGSILVIYEKNP